MHDKNAKITIRGVKISMFATPTMAILGKKVSLNNSKLFQSKKQVTVPNKSKLPTGGKMDRCTLYIQSEHLSIFSERISAL